MEALHAHKSLILVDGTSSLWVGPFPSASPFVFGERLALCDLTGSEKQAPAAHAAAWKAVAEDPVNRRYMNKPVGDHPMARDLMLSHLKMGNGDPTTRLLPWLLRAWDDGFSIYLHCMEGTSRAPTVACALLIALHKRVAASGGSGVLAGALAGGGGLADAALRFVRQARPLAQPNEGFLEALATFAGPEGAKEEVIDLT